MRGISAEEEERMRLEMKKMTATFTEEAAGEYSEDMRAMLGKKQKKKRAAGRVAPGADLSHIPISQPISHTVLYKYNFN